MGNKPTKIIAKRKLDCTSNLDYYNKYFIPRHTSIMEESYIKYNHPFKLLSTKQLCNFLFMHIENESCLKIHPKEYKNDQERYKYWELVHFIQRKDCSTDVSEHFLYDYKNIQKSRWFDEKRACRWYQFLEFCTKREKWYPVLIEEIKNRKDFDLEKFGDKIKKLQEFYDNISTLD